MVCVVVVFAIYKITAVGPRNQGLHINKGPFGLMKLFLFSSFITKPPPCFLPSLSFCLYLHFLLLVLIFCL